MKILSGTKALIVAGGRGSRLGKKTKKIPKPMINIGYLPLLEHQIRLLKRYGVKEFFLLTGYLSEVIEKHFKDGRDFGVNITYFKEKKPLGTAGGIKEIGDKLKEDFIIAMGDVMLEMDIGRLFYFHKRKKSAFTLVLHPNNHPDDSDLVEIDRNQKIIAFYSKPHPKNKYFRNLVNAGLYVLSPKILKYIKKGEKVDFGKDVFPKVIKKEAVYGYNTAEYLKDIGTPERLTEVKRDYSSGKIKRFNRKNKRRAIFMDRDGVINEDIGWLHKLKDFELLPGIAKVIKKINDSEFLAVMITNQPVVARGLCSIEELEEIHKKMETLLGRERAKLDAVYYCPHHPDKGFPEENKKYKIKCNCRKPKIGLFLKAQKEFNINFKKSYLIGDQVNDILAGKRLGCRTILVETGHGKDYKPFLTRPDFVAKNLAEAVKIINP